jgi:hypothetical protein
VKRNVENMNDHQPRYQDSRYNGLQQNPLGSNWPDPLPREPRHRLWPIAVVIGLIIGGIALISILL